MPSSPDFAEVERLNRKLRACAALLQRENVQLRAMVSNLLSLDSAESTSQSSLLSPDVNGSAASSVSSSPAIQEAACRRLLSATSPLHVKLEELQHEYPGSVIHAASDGDGGHGTSWGATSKAGPGVRRHTEIRGYVPDYVAFGEDSYNHWVARATRDAKQAIRDERRGVENRVATDEGAGAYQGQGSGRSSMDGARVLVKGLS